MQMNAVRGQFFDFAMGHFGNYRLTEVEQMILVDIYRKQQEAKQFTMRIDYSDSEFIKLCNEVFPKAKITKDNLGLFVYLLRQVFITDGVQVSLVGRQVRFDFEEHF